MNLPWKNNFRKITPYVPGEQSKNKNIIKLNANENPYPPSPDAVEAISGFDFALLRKYPPSDALQLKRAIADFYGVGEKNVFVGNGSDDVLALAFQAFFNSDLPVVFPDLTYSFYPVWCDLFKISYVTAAVGSDFRINPSDYAAPNGGVVIPNPNAPSSLGEDNDFVRSIMRENGDCVVIIDEAYADFAESSAVELTGEYPNLLVTGTFSKSRSLAGLRIGFAIGSEELVSQLEAIKNSYNSYTVDSIAIAAAAASIRDREYFKSTVAKIVSTRTRLIGELRRLGFSVLDSSTNFVLATHADKNMKEMFLFLKSKNIFIRYFDLPRISDYVRITVGTDEEIDALLGEIKNFLSK